MVPAGMCPMPVVIAREFTDQIIQVTSAEHDESGKTLVFDRANEFFAPAVEIWGRDRQGIRFQAVLLQ